MHFTLLTRFYLCRPQRLVESHLNNMLDLVALNGASETAYDNTSGALNHSLQLVKKQLATEAEAVSVHAVVMWDGWRTRAWVKDGP